jgi:hypothetical protein
MSESKKKTLAELVTHGDASTTNTQMLEKLAGELLAWTLAATHSKDTTPAVFFNEHNRSVMVMNKLYGQETLHNGMPLYLFSTFDPRLHTRRLRFDDYAPNGMEMYGGLTMIGGKLAPRPLLACERTRELLAYENSDCEWGWRSLEYEGDGDKLPRGIVALEGWPQAKRMHPIVNPATGKAFMVKETADVTDDEELIVQMRLFYAYAQAQLDDIVCVDDAPAT